MDSLPFGPFRDLQMLLASTFLPRLYQMQCPNGNFVPYVQVPKRPVPFTQIPCMRGDWGDGSENAYIFLANCGFFSLVLVTAYTRTGILLITQIQNRNTEIFT